MTAKGSGKTAAKDSGKTAAKRESGGSAAPCSVLVTLSGLVQGVGFRPFLHRIALQNGLSGWARNTSGGLEAFVTGAFPAVETFLQAIQNDAPPLSRVEQMAVRELPAAAFGAGSRPDPGFHILDSAFSEEATFAGADTAPCPDCEKELFTPGNRRFRYPFINCTNCGPRYTIIRSLPYDRSRTAMDAFPMCPDCLGEYKDIRDRRYHAQPDCCPACGPSVFLLDAAGKPFTGADADPFLTARRLLSEGKILAVKGTGGIHLACDAYNTEAVARLRRQKKTPCPPPCPHGAGSGNGAPNLPRFRRAGAASFFPRPSGASSFQKGGGQLLPDQLWEKACGHAALQPHPSAASAAEGCAGGRL